SQRPPAREPGWCCFRNCTTARTSASASTSPSSTAPSRSRDPAPSGSASLPPNMAWSSSARCSSAAGWACTTTRPCAWKPTGAAPIPLPSPGPRGRRAAEHVVVIFAPRFWRAGVGLYHNTAVVLEADGRLAGKYRKMHIPDDPGFNEKFYFTPGDLGFHPVDTSVGRLGVLVCWDQWYPEGARLMALAGAELLLYPTAIGWD